MSLTQRSLTLGRPNRLVVVKGMYQPNVQYGHRGQTYQFTQDAVFEEAVVREIGCYTAQLDAAIPDADGILRISVTVRPDSNKVLLKILSFLFTGHLAPISGTKEMVHATLSDLISLSKAGAELKITKLVHAVINHMGEFLHGDWLRKVGYPSDEVEKVLNCIIAVYKLSLPFKSSVLERAVVKQIESFSALTTESFIDVASEFLDLGVGAQSTSLACHFKHRLKQLLPSVGGLSQSYRTKIKQGALQAVYLDLLEEEMLARVSGEEIRAVASGRVVRVKDENDD